MKLEGTGTTGTEGSTSMPDPGDEHVLATAITARCDTLVTDNLKDFRKRRENPVRLSA